MLLDEIKNIKSSKSDLRKFGLSVGIVLGLLGGALWWKGRDSYPYFLVVAAFLVSSGMIFPSVLKPLQKVWMTFAVVMGWIMTRVILTVAFYMVITPVGMILRILGKDFLNRSFEKDASTYWVAKSDEVSSKNTYEKQF
jgi:hypothetical protein